MIRIAILEKEQWVKDILYECVRLFAETECSFGCYTKISQLIKGDANCRFDMIILHGMFDTPRVLSALMPKEGARIVLFSKESSELGPERKGILEMDRRHIRMEMKRIAPQLITYLRNRQVYHLRSRRLSIPLIINDIYYIEKQDKNVIYHTARGLFHERKVLKELEELLYAHNFWRIHSRYLINSSHISAYQKDALILHGEIRLPIARARRAQIQAWIQHSQESVMRSI